MRSGLIRSKTLTIADGATALPSPSEATDGVDVSSWAQGGKAPSDYAVAVRVAASSTITDPYLAGYRGGQWYHIGRLNGGRAMSLTAAVGWAGRSVDLGLFDRVAFVASGSWIGVTVEITPVE